METVIQSHGNIGGKLNFNATILPAPTPTIMPMMPPAIERKSDSKRNWRRILLLGAPIDFLMPISLVLSVTLTSMMFIMPTPAVRRAIKLMMKDPVLIAR